MLETTEAKLNVIRWIPVLGFLAEAFQTSVLVQSINIRRTPTNSPRTQATSTMHTEQDLHTARRLPNNSDTQTMGLSLRSKAPSAV